VNNRFRYAKFYDQAHFDSWHEMMKTKLGVAEYAKPIPNLVDNRVITKVRLEDLDSCLTYRSFAWAYVNDFWPHDEIMDSWDKSKTYKIYKYLNFNSFEDMMMVPFDVNYKTGLDTKLFVSHTFNSSPTGASHGELQKSIYYEYAEIDPVSGEPTNFQNPILEVAFTWVRDALGFVVQRLSEIKWYRWDGTLDTLNTKKMTKLYSKEDAIKEGKRRRGNIVDALYMPVLGFLIATEPFIPEDGGNELLRQQRLILTGRTFLAEHKASFDNFIDDSNKQIITDIANDTRIWLDNDISLMLGAPVEANIKIRTFLTDAFSISV
jgi:hypothetical protein